MGLFGSRGYSGLFYKMGDDNSVANDMSKNVERGDRGHVFHILSKFGKFHDFANFCRSRTKLAPKKSKK